MCCVDRVLRIKSMYTSGLSSSVVYLLKWGTVDADIKNPPGESPELSKVPSFKPGVSIL